MEADKFLDNLLEKDDNDYGLCTPPIKADEGLDVLIAHFLGEDWYSTMPMSQEQVYTEAIYKILERNQKPKNIFYRFFNFLRDLV